MPFGFGMFLGCRVRREVGKIMGQAPGRENSFMRKLVHSLAEFLIFTEGG